MLYSTGTLTARSLQGFRANRLRLVRAVAFAIGISLFLPMEQVSQASIVPTKKTLKMYTRSLLPLEEYKCISQLWGKESAWNHLADNPDSTAFGIPQILGLKTVNPYTQIHKGLTYIERRYSNSACKAWKFHKRNGWY